MINFIGALCIADIFSNKMQIYIGDVSYDLHSQSLRALGKKNSKYHYIAFPGDFEDNNFVDLLLLKRKSFKYEKETRLVILVHSEQQYYIQLCYKPKMLQTFVRSIQISPSCSDTEATSLANGFRNTFDSWDRMSNFYNIEISQSNLYKRVPSIIVER